MFQLRIMDSMDEETNLDNKDRFILSQKSSSMGLADYKFLSCSMSWKNKINHNRDIIHISKDNFDVSSLTTQIESSFLYTIKDKNDYQNKSNIQAELEYSALQTRRALQLMYLSLTESNNMNHRDLEMEEMDDMDNDIDPLYNNNIKSNSQIFDGISNVQISMDLFNKLSARFNNLDNLVHKYITEQTNLEKKLSANLHRQYNSQIVSLQDKITYLEHKKQSQDNKINGLHQQEKEYLQRITLLSTTSSDRSTICSICSIQSNDLKSICSPLTPVNSLSDDPSILVDDSCNIVKIVKNEKIKKISSSKNESDVESRLFARRTISDFFRKKKKNESSTLNSSEGLYKKSYLKDQGNIHLDSVSPNGIKKYNKKKLANAYYSLSKHVKIQDFQLNQAKKLLLVAIKRQEEATQTAEVGWQVTQFLDKKLMKTNEEIFYLKNQLERLSK